MREWVGCLLHYFLASLLLNDSGLSSFQSLWGSSRWNRKRNVGWEFHLDWHLVIIIVTLWTWWKSKANSLLRVPQWFSAGDSYLAGPSTGKCLSHGLSRLLPHLQGILVLIPLVLLHPLRLQLDKTLFKTTQTNFPLQGAHLSRGKHGPLRLITEWAVCARCSSGGSHFSAHALLPVDFSWQESNPSPLVPNLQGMD